MSETPMKRCTKCGEEKPATAEYFVRQSSHKDGLTSECRDCRRMRNKNYYNSHLESERERIMAYNETHKSEAKSYREAHRKEIRAYMTNYYADRREEYSIRSHAYYATPKGRLVAIENAHRRRLLKAQSGQGVTKDEYDAVLKAHTNPKTGQIICAWCGKPIEGGWHFDHWIPLSKGGKHEAGNLRVMHGKSGDKCNLRKGASLPFDFGRLL